MVYKKFWGTSICVTKGNWGSAWVKWVHEMDGLIHCLQCMQLHGCYFTQERVPDCTLHEKCHCHLEPIEYAMVLNYAQATSNYKKFDPYLFNTNRAYFHGKEKMFEQWGYAVEDAKWLQAEMERQAREKYINGEYTLGKLDVFGQRIKITIEIPKRTGQGVASFTSGWMVQPEGKLTLNTPYGGK